MLNSNPQRMACKFIYPYQEHFILILVKRNKDTAVHTHAPSHTHAHTPLSFETLVMLFLNEGRLRDYNQNFHLSQGLIA